MYTSTLECILYYAIGCLATAWGTICLFNSIFLHFLRSSYLLLCDPCNQCLMVTCSYLCFKWMYDRIYLRFFFFKIIFMIMWTLWFHKPKLSNYKDSSGVHTVHRTRNIKQAYRDIRLFCPRSSDYKAGAYGKYWKKSLADKYSWFWFFCKVHDLSVYYILWAFILGKMWILPCFVSLNETCGWLFLFCSLVEVSTFV